MMGVLLLLLLLLLGGGPSGRRLPCHDTGLPHSAREPAMTFIFEVRLKPGFTAEEYAANWVKASDVIQRTAGPPGTRPDRTAGKPDTLLARASRENKAARGAKDDRSDEMVRRVVAEHAEKCEITAIGEFEEPEWEVPPVSLGGKSD